MGAVSLFQARVIVVSLLDKEKGRASLPIVVAAAVREINSCCSFADLARQVSLPALPPLLSVSLVLALE
jgi:hypothetical protein